MFRVELRTFWPPIATWRLVRDNGDIVAGHVSTIHYCHTVFKISIAKFRIVSFDGTRVLPVVQRRSCRLLWRLVVCGWGLSAKLRVGGRVKEPARVLHAQCRPARYHRLHVAKLYSMNLMGWCDQAVAPASARGMSSDSVVSAVGEMFIDSQKHYIDNI